MLPKISFWGLLEESVTPHREPFWIICHPHCYVRLTLILAFIHASSLLTLMCLDVKGQPVMASVSFSLEVSSSGIFHLLPTCLESSVLRILLELFPASGSSISAVEWGVGSNGVEEACCFSMVDLRCFSIIICRRFACSSILSCMLLWICKWMEKNMCKNETISCISTKARHYITKHIRKSGFHRGEINYETLYLQLSKQNPITSGSKGKKF